MTLAPLVRETPRPDVRRAIARGGPEWPSALEALRDPPAVLFAEGGRLPELAHAVAIVGARAATAYGRERSHRLAHDLAVAGYTVVSGLARGIDAAAHEGALAAGGRTVAVLPSGLETITPPEHVALAGRIRRSGALVSEVREGGPFGPGAFVRRNRLIAALAAATVVVEAGERSGALTTAAFAERMGRLRFAVPGDLDRPGSLGPLEQLRRGARVCADAGDVCSALARAGHAAPPGDARARLSSALTPESRTVEALAASAGLSVADTLAHLMALEWAGLASCRPGGRWVRRS